ncbi:unnamed protein product, partial [Brassica oleracea var. botrytis]
PFSGASGSKARQTFLSTFKLRVLHGWRRCVFPAASSELVSSPPPCTRSSRRRSKRLSSSRWYLSLSLRFGWISGERRFSGGSSVKVSASC